MGSTTTTINARSKNWMVAISVNRIRGQRCFIGMSLRGGAQSLPGCKWVSFQALAGVCSRL
jgi:hypothetical protein